MSRKHQGARKRATTVEGIGRMLRRPSGRYAAAAGTVGVSGLVLTLALTVSPSGALGVAAHGARAIVPSLAESAVSGASTSRDTAPAPRLALLHPGPLDALPVTVPGTRGGTVASTSESSALTTSTSDASIPAPALSAYQAAAQVIDKAAPTCHLDWRLLAAIGQVESAQGTSKGGSIGSDGVVTPALYGPVLRGGDTDHGKIDGDAKADRAVGPLQIIPSTWSTVAVDADGDGKRDPQDIDDAALGAAVLLCAGHRDLSSVHGQTAALWSWNHSKAYAARVLAAYQDIVDNPPGSTTDTVRTVDTAPSDGSTTTTGSGTSPTVGDGTTQAEGGPGRVPGSGHQGGHDTPTTPGGGSSSPSSPSSPATPKPTPSTPAPTPFPAPTAAAPPVGFPSDELPPSGQPAPAVVSGWMAARQKALAPLGLDHDEFVVLATLTWLETKQVPSRDVLDSYVHSLSGTAFNHALWAITSAGLVRLESRGGVTMTRTTAVGDRTSDQAVAAVLASDDAYFSSSSSSSSSASPSPSGSTGSSPSMAPSQPAGQ